MAIDAVEESGNTVISIRDNAAFNVYGAVQLCDVVPGKNEKSTKTNWFSCFLWSRVRGSNPPPPVWETGALPDELTLQTVLL